MKKNLTVPRSEQEIEDICSDLLDICYPATKYFMDKGHDITMAGHLASTFYMYGVVLLYDKIGDEINDIKELESFREQLLDIASKIIQMPKQTVATMAGLYNGGVLLNEVGLTGYITNNMVGVETGDDSDLDLTYKMMAKIEGYIDSLEI